MLRRRRQFHHVKRAVFLLICMTDPGARNLEAQGNARFDFRGKLLVVACDTDMVPSAYVDGNLGLPAGADVLSVIRLGQDPIHLHASTVPVTNSVTGPPVAVAVTPSGQFAIVIETQGPRPMSRPNATMKDLAPGKKITVVDLSNPDKLAIVQQIESYERAVSVAVNPTGTLVAITFAPKGHRAPVPLVIYRFNQGRLQSPSEPKVPDFAATDELIDAEFLPGKDVLGIVYNSPTHPRLSLLQYSEVNSTIELTAWGNPVDIDASPFLVKFTSDGRFALVNSMHADANFRGTVTSIALAANSNASGNPQHAIVSHVEAGDLPEGLAVSPDGRWVATANLEESYRPLTDPKQQFFASISLFRLEPATGHLQRMGEFPFDGLLPEPIVFDNSSRFIAAGSFGRYDDPLAGGSIHFWRIADRNPQSGRVELIKLNESVPMTRGPQSMAIVR